MVAYLEDHSPYILPPNVIIIFNSLATVNMQTAMMRKEVYRARLLCPEMEARVVLVKCKASIGVLAEPGPCRYQAIAPQYRKLPRGAILPLTAMAA